MTWIRVTDKETGHAYDVAEQAFDPDIHSKVNASTQWPDLVEETDRPRPPIHRTDKAGRSAAPRTAGSPASTEGNDR